MRLYFAMGLAVTWGGFMAATPAPANAAEVCHFLECVDGDTQAPPPAPLPRKPAAPAIQNSERPKLQGEVCDSAGNLRYCVSSVLPQQYGFNYRPKNLFDGKYDTAWVPDTGKSVDGLGEEVVIDFAPGVQIKGLEMLNGYHKNFSIYAKNNRVAKIEITLPGVPPQLIDLQDGPDPVAFNLDAPVTVPWIRLKIAGVHRGSKYRDTAITELRIIQ
jgi:hypothetical protein